MPSSTIRDLLAVTEQPGMRSLAGGLPDPAAFPRDRLAAAAATVLGSDGGVTALQYGATDGLVRLRTLLAHAADLHGLGPSNPEAFVVTTGSQQAIDLIARALVDPGDSVVVDDPCYLGARQALVAMGADLVGIPVDDDGMRVDVLADRLRAPAFRPRVVYTVANFQNPTGAVLTTERRDALVELAHHYGFVVVDDDPYHALWFDGPSPIALGALDDDRVVSLGSCSKVLAPGLRVGWLRAPSWLRDTLVRVKQACDLHTSTLAQAIAADVLADTPFMTEHLSRSRSAYARKSRVLAEALQGCGSGRAPRGGMFLWRHFHGADTEALLAAAIADQVAFVPGSAFAVDRSWTAHARLSFATLDRAGLVDAAAVLRSLVDRGAAQVAATPA